MDNQWNPARLIAAGTAAQKQAAESQEPSVLLLGGGSAEVREHSRAKGCRYQQPSVGPAYIFKSNLFESIKK